MLKENVIAHFGTLTAVAEALNIRLASVSEWGEIIPKGRAYELQIITGGALQVDPALYVKRDLA